MQSIKYGMLTVLETVERPQVGLKKKVFWRCQCDCGETLVVRADNVRIGATRSCGCQVAKTHHRQIREALRAE